MDPDPSRSCSAPRAARCQAIGLRVTLMAARRDPNPVPGLDA